jgi:hypothetical protein
MMPDGSLANIHLEAWEKFRNKKITSIGLCPSEGNFESKHPQLHLR